MLYFERLYRRICWIIIWMVVMVAFTAIAMLERMSPAIQKILTKNLRTLETVESLYGVLGTDSINPKTESKQRFAGLLKANEALFADERDQRLLRSLNTHYEQAIEGDESARREVILTLMEISNLNKEDMLKADEQARFLGIAGGWSISILTIMCLTVAWVLLNKIRRQIIQPTANLTIGLADFKKGNRMRRFNDPAAATELKDAFSMVNDILDENAKTAHIVHHP